VFGCGFGLPIGPITTFSTGWLLPRRWVNKGAHKLGTAS
jgi:hypothetical protein